MNTRSLSLKGYVPRNSYSFTHFKYFTVCLGAVLGIRIAILGMPVILIHYVTYFLC